MSRRRYLYRPPPADHPLLATAQRVVARLAPVPPSVERRSEFLTVRDQGQEGCCSGFSTAAFREWLAGKGGQPLPTSNSGYLSPAYLYARTRMKEGTFPGDAGATVADEMLTLQNYGVCPESFLPYTGRADEAPTPPADSAAAHYRLPSPAKVVVHCDPLYVKQALVSSPVVFGMPVHESFEEIGSDGVVPTPGSSEALLGGHAMLAVGYNDATQRFTIRNSWGPKFGDGGYVYLPYMMVLSWYEAWAV